MKLSILQQDVLPVLSAVSRSVGVRSTLPVLGNILLSAEGAKLKVAATNLEVGVIKYVSAEVIEPGEITIPAKTLVEIVQGLGPAKVEIETNADSLTLSSGKFKASVNGISSSEFPVIPVSEGAGVSFKSEVLKGCQEILFASAADEGRPILTGILTEASSGKVDFVATDGFRLAHRQIKLEDSKVSFKSLIPRRTFEEVLRVIGEDAGEDETVEISTAAGQNQVVFKAGQTVVSSRLIEGNFPAWEKIIPVDIKARGVVDRVDLLSAVKLASVFAKSESNVVTVKIEKDKLSISSEAKELGNQQNEVEAQIEGESLEIAFNAKFLLDALQATNSTQLMMEFSGPLSPTLIKPVGIEGLEYIIMPVRLS